MGRGDLAKVRSAKDRQRKVKEREKRRAGERGAARKATKKSKRIPDPGDVDPAALIRTIHATEPLSEEVTW